MKKQKLKIESKYIGKAIETLTEVDKNFCLNKVNKELYTITIDDVFFKEFVDLAKLLAEIIAEEDRELPIEFVVSQKTISSTATFLAEGYLIQCFNKTNGAYYYSGMLAEYGGRIYDAINVYKTKHGIEII